MVHRESSGFACRHIELALALIASLLVSGPFHIGALDDEAAEHAIMRSLKGIMSAQLCGTLELLAQAVNWQTAVPSAAVVIQHADLHFSCDVQQFSFHVQQA